MWGSFICVRASFPLSTVLQLEWSGHNTSDRILIESNTPLCNVHIKIYFDIAQRSALQCVHLFFCKQNGLEIKVLIYLLKITSKHKHSEFTILIFTTFLTSFQISFATRRQFITKCYIMLFFKKSCTYVHMYI